MSVALRAHGVAVRRGGTEVLRGVDLELVFGSVTLLCGRNGSGKTTLVEVLGGVRGADSGVVTVGGEDLHGLAPRVRARRIALIPQDVDSPFEFTGRELITMGRHVFVPRFGGPGQADMDAVDRAIDATDCGAFVDRSVATLSGGERQRVAIARALATEARILLADEPIANLDLDHALQVLALLRSVAEGGGTVLVVSHDLNTVAPWADHVAVLHEGRLAGAPAAAATALAPDVLARVFGVCGVPPADGFPRRFALLDQEP